MKNMAVTLDSSSGCFKSMDRLHFQVLVCSPLITPFCPCPVLENFIHVRTLKSRHHADPPWNMCPAGIACLSHGSIMLCGIRPIWKCPFKDIATCLLSKLVPTVCCTVLVYLCYLIRALDQLHVIFTRNWSSERLSNLASFTQGWTKPNTWLMNT